MNARKDLRLFTALNLDNIDLQLTIKAGMPKTASKSRRTKVVPDTYKGNIMKKKRKYVYPHIKVVYFTIESGFRISATIGDDITEESPEPTERITIFHQEGEWF